MRIKVSQSDGASVLRIEGDLRIGSVADAKSELVAALATGSDIVLDLSALDECDTAGIQLLLMTCASARAKGKSCSAIGHTVAFRAALDRVGIPVASLEVGSAAEDAVGSRQIA